MSKLLQLQLEFYVKVHEDSGQIHENMNYCKHLHVNFHDDENMKPRPINTIVMLVRAGERLEVATFFMIWESSDSLLRSSPVGVTSKKAMSCETS